MHKKYKKTAIDFPALLDIARFYMDLDQFTAQHLSTVTGVNIKTAQRWLRESSGISAGNKKMLELDTNGHTVPHGWRDDCRFINDFLVINDGAYTFSYSDLCGYWLRLQQFDWTKAELKQAKATINSLERKIIKLESQVQETASECQQQIKPVC